MVGYVVIHAGSGSIGEIHETEEQAQLAKIEQIEEHLAEAVSHEFNDQDTPQSLADFTNRKREEWRSMLFVCEWE
ncbi:MULTISPECIES: hypothetical protein [Pseudomonas putida group]|uniref:hypothetical protein n=1 Tax=Pseudomonas putida group TaxID=136845 RepID=UPI000A0F718B|nr:MULTISPECIES: hypothetical protein [Pseudomonas putida group]MEC4024894.1 hypothetical protein [Pseudomonas fulva]ORL53302.1 hypothetical protein B7H18_02620 [Pseudomonas putida]